MDTRYLPLNCVSLSLSPSDVFSYLGKSIVISSPTESELIIIINISDIEINISGWTLGDKNNPDAYIIPNNTIISGMEQLSFDHDTINFQINNSSEIIYLKNQCGTLIDVWQN